MTSIQGLVLKADGTHYDCTLETLEDFRRAVGGRLERLFDKNQDLIFFGNSEGALRDLPCNPWKEEVYGDMLVMGADSDGEEQTLSDELKNNIIGSLYPQIKN